MNQDDFETAVRRAIAAHPMSGWKWKPLEEVFAEEGIRGSGALNNQEAERRTRVRQLFTTRRHPTFEGYDYSHHCVFVINQDAATRQVEDADREDEIEETYLDRARADVIAERPSFEQGGNRSVLILRFDGEYDQNEEIETEEVDGEEVAIGEIVPLLLMVWEEDEITDEFREWYPDVDIEEFAAGRRGTEGSANVVVRRGELTPPSTGEGHLLVGLDDAFDRSVAALRSGKHLVLYGPPGTGKTELAEYLCSAMIERPPNHYDFATATSDWTTFDTIGGYMPHPRDDGENLLDFHPGIVTSAMESGRWLVIDEINRADVDKAFGELFTLLAGKSVKLPYRKYQDDDGWLDVVLGNAGSDGVYGIPMGADWRLIGTLNTFDKASLYQLSYAFMRRFAFVEVGVPDRASYEALLDNFVDDLLEDESEEIRSEVKSRTRDLFAPAPGDGLSAVGIAVGPAIALDAVRYCRGRLQEREESPTDQDEVETVVRGLVLEAVESLLYPQFEGRDREHGNIRDAIHDSLNLSQEQVRKTSRRLAVWTGAESAEAEVAE